jgi:hypothetical protein
LRTTLVMILSSNKSELPNKLKKFRKSRPLRYRRDTRQFGKTKQNNYSFLHVQYRCEAFNQDFKETEGHGEGGPILASTADSKPIYL